MKLTQKRVWITGASSGIGEAIARQLAGVASLIIISGRDRKRLEEVGIEISSEETSVEVVDFDLGDPAQVERAAAVVLQKFGGVDVLINNGGISQRSIAHETSPSVNRKIMEVNFFGQVLLTRLLLPSMISQGSSHIAVTSSLTGKFGFPLRSSYAASKHALHGYFESLGLELYRHGIRTTVVCPGRIRTRISVNALVGSGEKHNVMDPGQAKGMSAEKCASKYIRAIEKNQWEAYIGGPDILMIWFRRYLPALFRRLALKVSAL